MLAKVAIPILGLDFFRKFQLSIHPLQCQVMNKAGQPISAIFAAAAAADTPPQQNVIFTLARPSRSRGRERRTRM